MTPLERPWIFFLSYAHADAASDGLLKQFASDLDKFVTDRLVIQPPAGFFDKSDILVGMDWSDRLGEALRRSLVLVCMISKEYLKSENCGKELDIFLRRRALLPASTNAQIIIPVFWEAPTATSQLPSSISDFQISDNSLPGEYLNWGARAIAMKRDLGSVRESDPYRQLLSALSIKIVSAATEHPLPEIAAEEVAAFGKLSNALLPSAPLAPANSNSGKVYEINFIYAIPAAGEFTSAPPRDGYSTDGGWYWQPFRATDEGIGQLVYQAPSKYRRHEYTVIKSDLVGDLIAKGRQDQLVILLVDPWAVLNPVYLDFFQTFDESAVPNSAVIAVGSDDYFEHNLTLAFGNTYPRLKDTPYFRGGITTKELLLQALNATFNQLIDNIVKRRRLGNRFPGPDLRQLAPPGRVA